MLLTCSISVDPKTLNNLFREILRRDDRVADCATLERSCAGNGTEGSNPSLSAMIFSASHSEAFFGFLAISSG